MGRAPGRRAPGEGGTRRHLPLTRVGQRVPVTFAVARVPGSRVPGPRALVT